MVKETIEGIRETEKQADAIVKDAQAKCQQILEEAAEKAQTMKDNHIADLKTTTQGQMDEAAKQGDLQKEDAKLRVEKEIEAIKYLAEQKEDEVVDSVLHSFI